MPTKIPRNQSLGPITTQFDFLSTFGGHRRERSHWVYTQTYSMCYHIDLHNKCWKLNFMSIYCNCRENITHCAHSFHVERSWDWALVGIVITYQLTRYHSHSHFNFHSGTFYILHSFFIISKFNWNALRWKYEWSFI